MADLSVYMSRKVNGVAEIHSQILRDDLFRAWNEIPRPHRERYERHHAAPLARSLQPGLTELIRAEIGEGLPA